MRLRAVLTAGFAALVLAALQSAPQPHAPEDLFTQIFNRSVVQQRTMRSVRARFTETTSSSLLVNPIVAHGTLVAAAPARVRMVYTDPEAKTITIDGKSLREALRSGQVRVQPFLVTA